MAEVSRRTFLQTSAVVSAGTLAGAGIAPAPAQGEDTMMFEAGVAVRDITPPDGSPLWGYSNVERLAEGALDPLQARAVVFRVGTEAVGLVTLDLGRVPMPEVVARIRETARAQGIGQVILSASHTHSAPAMEALDAPYQKPIEQGIVDALTEAYANLQPARIGVGRAEVDISHNRRLIKNGKAYMMWRNEERHPTSPIDHEAGIIRVDAAGGKPLVTLVNFACHPVIFGPDNKQCSADWPGEMCKLVRNTTGADCMFLQGGAGDINPYLDKTPLSEGGVASMRAEGAKAAKAVLQAWKKTEAIPPKAPSVQYCEEMVHVGTRWDLRDPQQADILRTVSGRLYDVYVEAFLEKQEVPLGVLVLNNTLALVFTSGEMFVQFQLDLKRNSPLNHTFLCGYANDFHVYIPTIRDAAVGGYGASTTTFVAIGAGEKLMARGAALVGEMTGEFGPLRGAEDFELNELT